MKIRKSLALLLTALFLMSTLAGCAKTEQPFDPSPSPSVSAPVSNSPSSPSPNETTP